ncbi:MAG: hypothetical protein HYY50_01355 [Candidatus Kerfeldbacteria bacterium]|nr:hypothetical protein [Candidatus Kerfeldbacteria bacterium]
MFENDKSKVRRPGVVDRLIDFLSGSAPAASLEGHRAYRLAFFFGLLGLGLGAWLIRQTITSLGQQPVPSVTNEQTPVAKLAELKTKDTDEDGLSDFDELYGSKTSPYLRDSDSDGVADGDELRQGTDPNCPSGKACAGIVGGGPTTDSGGQLTPEFLRQALRDSGVAQNTLEGLSDDQLLGLYQQVVQGATNTNALASITLDDLKKLSGDEVRQLLQDSGISSEELSKLDDATLKKIFQQALEQ